MATTAPATTDATATTEKQLIEYRVEEGLAIEHELQQLLFQSDAAKEGLAAYVEKRMAEFKGT